jgi:hypothetical protein
LQDPISKKLTQKKGRQSGSRGGAEALRSNPSTAKNKQTNKNTWHLDIISKKQQGLEFPNRKLLPIRYFHIII